MRGQKQSDRPMTIRGTGYEFVLFSASGFVTSNKRACFYVLFDGDKNLSDPTVRDRGSLFNDNHNRGEILTLDIAQRTTQNTLAIINCPGIGCYRGQTYNNEL